MEVCIELSASSVDGVFRAAEEAGKGQPMREFQFIEVDGATPRERGIQYGAQAKEKIRAGIEGYRTLFSRSNHGRWKEIAEYAASYIPLLEESMPDLLSEAAGIAAGADVPLEDVMVLNCRYEITKFPRESECTTCAVLPEASEGGKTLLVKNWDYRAGIIDNIVVQHIKEPEGTEVIGIGEAGQLIREGFNSHGIGLCNNSLQSVLDTRGVGIPVTFLRRKLFTCTTFQEAKDLLLTAKRSVSNNMLLASADGQAVNIEASPGGCDLIDPEDGIVTHANHFVVRPELNALEDSPRGERLNRLLREKHGSITVDYIKKCMSDHENYPKAICRHPSDVKIPLAQRGMTVAGMIVDFSENAVHICAGPPCEGEYVRYEIK